MRTRRSFSATEWETLGERLLDSAAHSLLQSAARRAQVAEDHFVVRLIDARSARVETARSDLVSREIGAPSRPPRPFLTPQNSELSELAESLGKLLKREGA